MTARNITSPELRHLHYKNWRLKICNWQLYFSSCLPQGNLRILLISSPACLVTLACVAGKISSLLLFLGVGAARRLGAFSKWNWNPTCLNCSFPASPSLFAGFWWNPAITKCHGTEKILGYRLYRGVFAIAKQSGPRGRNVERRKGRAWRNALMPPIHPRSSYKIFSWIAWAWYWKSAILSTALRICQHEDIWHQNGITEWQHQRHVSRFCCIPPPPSPPGHRFSFLTRFFALFPHCGVSSRLSKFGQSQIEKIFWMNDNALYGCIWIMNNNIKWIQIISNNASF